MSSSDDTLLTETRNVKEEVNSPSTVISASRESAPVTAASFTVPAPSMQRRKFNAELVSMWALSTKRAESTNFGWQASDIEHTYVFETLDVKMKLRFAKVYVLDGAGVGMTTPNVSCMTPTRLAILVKHAHEEYEVERVYRITDENQGYVITLQLLNT